ncbi:hypothetical protein [Pseudozobellia sp. WGM2]|uniref:hypothetical protein n=1 Tax=Pseudozobellia sp. WGM2 TaxID=2787625 RepID=UPI001AE06387|nr:hypothetical protein [Pseudozobellia sp. WGM2]
MATTPRKSSPGRIPFTAHKRLFTMLTIGLIIAATLGGLYYLHYKSNQRYFEESRLRSLDASYNIIQKQLDNKLQEYSAKQEEDDDDARAAEEKVKNCIELNNFIEEKSSEIAEKVKNLLTKNDENTIKSYTENLANNFKARKSPEEIFNNLMEDIRKDNSSQNLTDTDYIQIEESITNTYNTYYQIELDLNKQSKLWNHLDSLPISDFSPLFNREFDDFVVLIKDAEMGSIRAIDEVIQKASLKGKISLPNTLENSSSLKMVMGVSMGFPKEEEKYQLFARNYSYKNNLNKYIDYEFTLIGLVDSSRYNKAIKQLDPWIITLLTLFVLLLLFGLPYFKMLFIAEDERVYSKDVIISGISIIVGAPILMIVFLSLMVYYYDYNLKIPHQLEEINHHFKKAFIKENKEIIQALDDIDLTKENQQYKHSSGDKKRETPVLFIKPNEPQYRQELKYVIKTAPKKKPEDDDQTKRSEEGHVFFHMMFIDVPKNRPQKINNLSERPYYKAFKDPTNHWYSQPKDSIIAYVMRPVVSIDDQSEEAMYVLEDKKQAGLPGYKIGGAQLKSLHGAILPIGFQFAVLDDQGEVQFHSEKGRATLENFWEVSRSNGNLQAAISSRVMASGLIDYHEQANLYHISPIAGTNLSMVTLYDISLLRTRVAEALSLSYMALIIAFILLLTITFLSLVIRNPKLGLYKYERFHFEFLTPKKRCKNTYMWLSILLLILAFLSVVICSFLEPVNAYLFCLLATLYSYLIVFYSLQRKKQSKRIKFKVRNLLMGLSIIFINFFMYEASSNKPLFFIAMAIAQCICLTALFFSIKNGQGLYNPVKRKQIAYKLWISFKKKFATNMRVIRLKKKLFTNKLWIRLKKILSNNKKQSNKNTGFPLNMNYKYGYALFLFCWLLLAGIAPSFTIFHNSWDFCNKIALRTDELFMTQAYLNKKTRLKKNLPQFDVNKKLTNDSLWSVPAKYNGAFGRFKNNYEDHLKIGQYHQKIAVEHYEGKPPPSSKDHPFLDKMQWKARPFYDARLTPVQGMVYPYANDMSWTIDQDHKDLYLKRPNNNKQTDQLFLAQENLKKETNIKADYPQFYKKNYFSNGFIWDLRTIYKSAFSRFKNNFEDHLKIGQYHPKFTIEQFIGDSPPPMEGHPFLDKILWKARPIFDSRLKPFQGMVYPTANDDSWIVDLDHKDLYLKTPIKNKWIRSIKISEEKEHEKGLFLSLYFIGFVLILAGLFSLILFFTDRFFGFRFSHLEASNFDTDKKNGYEKKFGNILKEENSNGGLLLVGPPFSGKYDFAKKIFKEAKYTKVVTLSMLQLENTVTDLEITDILKHLLEDQEKDIFDWKEQEGFIIKHLEHNIKSFSSNHLKLRVLLFLISHHKRIILISEVYPTQIFSMYENPAADINLPWGSIEDDFNSWRNILSAFPQILIGITKDKSTLKLRLSSREESIELNSWDEEMLYDELGYSKFLPTLAPIVATRAKDKLKTNHIRPTLDHQRMIMHTQNLAHGYYNDIWNSLPTRERYLLYDLAKDGFMNIKNRNSLFSLMKKGLIIWDDRPRIFNESFKNFVTTSVSLNEALRLESKNRGSSSWASVRILIYIVIIVVISVIALGNQELMANFKTVIAALGALGAIIPTLSKMMASGASKP